MDSGTVRVEPAIQAAHLAKRYAGTLAVDSLDLTIARGEFYGLLGPNGAGKTTVVHLLSTLVRPSAGTARVAGHSILDAPLCVRRAIGVVFQEPSLDPALTVMENLRFAGRLNALPAALIRERSERLAQLLGLEAARARRAGALSGGMRRALDVARALLHQPEILFLDEPTLGLDVANRRAMWRDLARLRERLGVTILLTTHYLEEAEACDRVGFIAEGRLALQGTPAELTRACRRSNLNDVFLDVLRDGGAASTARETALAGLEP